jgi:hypothetical protein
MVRGGRCVLSEFLSSLRYISFILRMCLWVPSDALIFGNLGMNHCIAPMQPANYQVNRVVLSLFVKMNR